jgi:diaminopimelate decarboxylase
MRFENLETPCFILDEDILAKNYQNLETSFKKEWHNLIIGYSYKTNSLPWLIQWMKEKGALAEVVSSPEFELAKYIGYKTNEIILNGPNKGNAAILQILEADGIINLDGFHEIEFLEQLKPADGTVYKLGLRINFDLESACPNESLTAELPSRFGFNLENGDFEEAAKRLSALSFIKIVGLHTHASTKTKSLNIFRSLARKAVEASQFIMNTLEYIDIGGGLVSGIPNAPSYADYAAVISEELTKRFNPKETALIVEPGICLAASCFQYLCEVIDSRTIKGQRLLSTNGSTMQIDPQMRGRKFPIEIISNTHDINKDVKPHDIQVLTGYTCIELDRFATLKDEKVIFPKDKILLKLTGAYTISFTPLFIEYFPNIYVKKDNEYTLVRAKWGVNEYVQQTIFQ